MRRHVISIVTLIALAYSSGAQAAPVPVSNPTERDRRGEAG